MYSQQQSMSAGLVPQCKATAVATLKEQGRCMISALAAQHKVAMPPAQPRALFKERVPGLQDSEDSSNGVSRLQAFDDVAADAPGRHSAHCLPLRS